MFLDDFESSLMSASPHLATRNNGMGEGGAIFTQNSDLKRIIESFRDWGRDCTVSQAKTTPVVNALAGNSAHYHLAMTTNTPTHTSATTSKYPICKRLVGWRNWIALMDLSK